MTASYHRLARAQALRDGAIPLAEAAALLGWSRRRLRRVLDEREVSLQGPRLGYELVPPSAIEALISEFSKKRPALHVDRSDS